MSICNFCDILPETDAPPATGVLYLAPPFLHTTNKMRHYFESCRVPCTEPSPGLLAIPLKPGLLVQLTEELSDALDIPELTEVRSLILTDGEEPSLANLMHMQPLSALLARTRGAWLISMMRDNRLVTHFQPIVETHTPDRVFAYEALLRGKQMDGTLIAPSEIFSVALEANLLNQLERASRSATVHAASDAGMTSKLFVNFNPATIYDPVFCLRSTLKAIDQSNIKPEQIVFEVVESTQVRDPKHLLRVMDFYRDHGFQVALDDMGAGYSSLSLMGKIKPDYVKLDIELIHCVDTDPYKSQIAGKLLEMAQSLGIKTIAEGVETEAEWHWARRHEADFVQGFLFARPAAPPPAPALPPGFARSMILGNK